MDENKIKFQKIGEIYTNKFIFLALAIIGYFVIHYFLMVILGFLNKKGIDVHLEKEFLKVIISLAVFSALHELAHFIAFWKLCRINRKQIYIRFYWKLLSLYCGCSLPTTVCCARIVLLAPLIITGILSLIMFIFFLSHWTVVLTSFSLSICAKDVIDFLKISKFPKNCLTVANPKMFGSVLILEPQPVFGDGDSELVE